MGTSGLEPPTSRLSGVRSNHLSYAPIQNCSTQFWTSSSGFEFRWNSICFANRRTSPFSITLSKFLVLLVQSIPCPYGGDEEDRTPDPLLAKQVLSQLSYTPILQGPRFPLCHCVDTKKSVPSKLNNKLHLTLELTELCFLPENMSP